jgi:hypothetical protein
VVLAVLGAGSCLSAQQRDPTMPLLTGLGFDGVSPENPTVLLFHVDFRDSDGDLAAGTLTPLVNGRATSDTPLSIRDIFLDDGMALDTPAGTLRFALEVQVASGAEPESGSRFDVGFQARDGAGKTSNAPTCTLEILY